MALEVVIHLVLFSVSTKAFAQIMLSPDNECTTESTSPTLSLQNFTINNNTYAVITLHKSTSAIRIR